MSGAGGQRTASRPPIGPSFSAGRRAHHLGLVCLAATFVLSTPTPTNAAPWVREPGSAYVQGEVRAFQGSATDTSPDYTTTTWNVYAEVGLPARLELTVSLPYVRATQRSLTAPTRYRHASLGDIRLALDHAPIARLPLTLGVEVKVPGYRDPSSHDEARGLDDRLFDPQRFPAIGDDNIDINPRVRLGHSFHPVPMWTWVEAGYLIRTRQRHGDRLDMRDGVAFAGNVGGWLWADRVALSAYSRAVFNVQAASADAAPTESMVYIQGKLTFADPRVAGLSVSLGAGGIAWVRNSERGHDVSVSVAYAF